ncbi:MULTISPECIES: DUF4382 domain-containing protein [unclassified Rhizobacter]|uniref:DUF4382 domain-containing protein n=1 Tax=unclassified Rhizobacter TaxID=2640088 RepID=UPI0006FF594D|nr:MULTISPECIES: DUF4382 domain-containing protein [unclassified Rhizobacter]KQU81099.1 hypothetical protein ASC88_16390 [Rhizobacter sp. Root29]KQW04643.1 hypothetical protein ASC98_06080 [Rhizobacter sp. Root1238]KRB06482.1 hypothetical protein ASE08_12620 [Rhizobacter sp. Root16D2]
MKTLRIAGASLVASVLIAAGCGGGGGIGGTGQDAGTMRVSIGDAPACGYEAVNVTIERVRVNKSPTAGEGDAGWSEVVLSPARRIDLLTLTNGVLEDLGQTTLPAGRYTQLRLVLATNDATHPLANSVVPSGGHETALETPSAEQSGLKLNLDVDVPVGKVVDVALDFDACRSIVRLGNSGRYNLKPVLSATTVLSDAGQRVVGYVDPAASIAGTTVSLQSGGTVVKAAAPDATGKFVLYPVPVGSYDLVVSATGRVTAVMTGVPVTVAAYTYVASASAPIAPPVSTPADRPVGGTVTPAPATVRALQTLGGTTTVEVRGGNVDGLTGAFQLLLPNGAPVASPYAADPLSLNFKADAGAAGHYVVEATSFGVSKTQAVDTSVPVAELNFTFP